MKIHILIALLILIMPLIATAEDENAPLPAMDSLLLGIPENVIGGGTRGISPPAKQSEETQAPENNKEPCNADEVQNNS